MRHGSATLTEVQTGLIRGVILNRVLQQISDLLSHQGVRLSLWALGSWCVTLGVVWTFSSYQPRLSIDLLGSTVVGFTSDSQELIAFKLARHDGEVFKNSLPPGSIEVWNLTTGRHRTIRVSASTWRSNSKSHWFEAENRYSTSPLLSDQWSMHGQWFEFSIADGNGNRPIASRNAILNLRDDSIRFSDNGESILLSPTGRWFRRLNWSHVPMFTICETATGKERLTVQEHSKVLGVEAKEVSPGRFSPDDLYFACATDGPQGVTRVWNMETGKVVLEIDKQVHAIEFSLSNRMLAGLIQAPASDANSSSNAAVVVWNVETGEVVHRHQLSSTPNIFARESRPGFMTVESQPALKFTENNTGLVCYRLLNDIKFSSYYTGPEENHLEVKVHFVWNFKSNAAMREFNDAAKLDPDRGLLSPDIHDHFPRFTTSRDKATDTFQIYDAATQQPVWTMPAGAEPLLLSPSGKTLVYKNSQQSPITRLIAQIGSRGVPIPAFIDSIVPQDSHNWSIAHLPSGRTASMSRRFWGNWLSPDEKTWVTKSSSDPLSNDFEVWDFPPRKPLLKPMVWSLAAPVILLTGWAFWRVIARRRERLISDSPRNAVCSQ